MIPELLTLIHQELIAIDQNNICTVYPLKFLVEMHINLSSFLLIGILQLLADVRDFESFLIFSTN